MQHRSSRMTRRLSVLVAVAAQSGDVRALRTHLRSLRRKLGKDAGRPTHTLAEPLVGTWGQVDTLAHSAYARLDSTRVLP